MPKISLFLLPSPVPLAPLVLLLPLVSHLTLSLSLSPLQVDGLKEIKVDHSFVRKLDQDNHNFLRIYDIHTYEETNEESSIYTIHNVFNDISS